MKNFSLSTAVSKILNHHKACVDRHQKTNNVSEVWHNLFRLVIRKNDPDIYSAPTKFQNEQADSEIMISKLSLGRKVKAQPKKKWFDFRRQIRIITLQYQDYRKEEKEIELLRLITSMRFYNVTYSFAKIKSLLFVNNKIREKAFVKMSIREILFGKMIGRLKKYLQ